MPGTLLSRKPPANRVLTVTVRRVIPAGLTVGLPDGREGLIRERELAWDAEARRGWRERHRPGDSLRVVLLHEEDGQRPELSLRLAQSDPWLDAEERYPVGVLVDGAVTGIMPYGIFVELEPGVTGMVHKSRFPTWIKGEPGDVFWPGDHVKATIGSLDTIGRRVDLSMTDLPRRRWEASEYAGAPRASRRQETILQPPAQHPLPLESLIQYGAKLILVVDDEQHVREELSGWLRNAGHAVLLARDSATAFQAIADGVPEIALVDIDLPDQSGIQVMRQLRAAWPEMRCILMTGRCDTHEGDAELSALMTEGVALLCKPFRPDELLACLYDSLAGGRPQATSRPAEPRAVVPPNRKDITSVSSDQLWLPKSLTHLRNISRANLVALFVLDPASRQVRLVEQAGQPALKTGVQPTLIHSPVRDAAEDGLIMRAMDMNEAAGPRFHHLFPLIPFGSCLGLPVSVELSERYALFLFFSQPALAGVAEIVEAHATATAAALAAWLERRQFTAQIAGLQRVMLLGQLSRSLIHEVNNQRQNLRPAVTMLKKRHQAIAKCAEKDATQLAWEIAEADGILQDLGQELDRLVGATLPFMFLTRQDQREFLLLDQVIRAAADMVRDTAHRANVALVLHNLAPFCHTRAPAATLQQVLVNILLNAIQQIELTHGRRGGQVLVRLAQIQHDGQVSYRIRVEDDGPGIHRRLWERIFEMGYTERAEGSGMGLFISRNLIEALGGRLSVAESAVGWGSAFVVELPQQN